MKKLNLLSIIVCIILICSMLLNAVGCAIHSPVGGVSPNPNTNTKNLIANIKVDDVTGLTADAQFISAQADFAVKLFQNTRTAGENTLISPLSVMLALAMSANGADAKTRIEMEKLLGGDIPIEKLNAYLYSYVSSLPIDEKYKLQIANSIWFRNNIVEVNDAFLQSCADYYNAAIYDSPFDNITIDDVNAWVNESTYGMIDEILDSIDPDDLMFIINALVFDAEWGMPYREDEISEGVFRPEGTEDAVRSVEMMHSFENLYLNDGMATGFIKNYKDGKYSFLALLPNEGVSLDDYIASLSGEKLLNLINDAEDAFVSVSLPQFEYEYEIKLNDALSSLGMKTAFNNRSADFSRLGTAPANIYICDVLHKTYITVNELGTRAGAITDTVFRFESAVISNNKVELDRPFMYLIIDNATNLPIFMGTVLDIGE